MVNNRFGKLIQKFLTNYIINECNYSINTKASYSATFYLLLEFLEAEKNIKINNNLEIENITKEVIIQFLDWLETSRNVSIQTRNQRLACIKSFYKYVQSNEPDLFETCSKILDIKNKKVPAKMISYFTEDEIKIMIDYLNETKNLKKLTIICVLYETGARVSELINIKLEDLNLNESPSITLYGKGGKIRVIPISNELVKLINKYLKEVYINYGDNYLFYSNYKKKYSRYSINKLVSSLVKVLKNKYSNYFKGHYHPHSFRHTKATHLYNNEIPLLYIKEFLGHKSIISTEIYTTPDSEKQRKEILKNSEAIITKKKYSDTKKDSLDNWLKNNMR